MGDMDSSIVEIGRKYKISLGKSIVSDRNTPADVLYSTLQYSFKPASVDENLPGSIVLAPSGEVSVSFHQRVASGGDEANTAEGGSMLKMKGSMLSQASNEYVFIIDDDHMRLEKVRHSIAGLRHERREDVMLDTSKIISDVAISKQIGKKFVNPKPKKPRPSKEKKGEAQTNNPIDGNEAALSSPAVATAEDLCLTTEVTKKTNPRKRKLTPPSESTKLPASNTIDIAEPKIIDSST